MNGRRLYLPVILMLLAIIAIATFQVYWLVKNYREEKHELTFRTNVIFREAIQHLRIEKLKLDTNFKPDIHLRTARYGAVGMIDAIHKRVQDTLDRDKKLRVFVTQKDVAYLREDIPADSPGEIHIIKEGPGPGIVRVLSSVDSLQDSISIQELSVKYAQMLKQQKVAVSFSITSQKTVFREDGLLPPPFEKENEVIIGFNHPVTYRLTISNTNPFVLQKMWPQFLLSLVLVGLTAFSFVLLFRSLIQQRKLTKIKNDFISNITHELKTPIATVSVAIEALRNFDALQDPEKTKEYLAISSNELQRLSFLVDKVLKLSMFEKHQVELKEEAVDLAVLVKEVVNSMKLQFEKYRAKVNVQLQGYQFAISADRLHITSVLFNLLDNALKYSKENPSIHVELKEETEQIFLLVTDNGIGIAPEYHKKIFDKFFRVPSGDTHNVKGYGLGLSYVAYVIQRHDGSIEVESQPGIGSRFIIKLPAIS
ncbi:MULTISPECIES: sensor histidine kinase [Niastella]|uniref:histidine kinase n=1 Tax=Niastella soli TaxID=2821487 RepID=A0ABS3YPQ3_9BACT|nr:HAMP domain-containing sensor histidine kinase [Niastella soli]MBO9199835.1 HAMP domain-containing histidine kinase [Niastella soli]